MFNLLTTLRKQALRGVAALSLLALAACDVTLPAPGGGPSINTSRPVPVALLVPRGSGQPRDEELAQSLENAARLAMADLDGVVIDLRVYATAGTGTQAAAAAAQAVSDGARILLGPVYAEAANAAGVAVAPRNINVLSFSNNPTIAGGNVFILGQTFQNTANRLIGYGARQGKANVVIVHSNDVAGQLGRNAIETAALGNATAIGGVIPYELSQQSVIAAIPQVQEAVRNTNADTVFLTSTTAGALPLFAQLLPEAGIRTDEVQYMGLTRWDIPPQTLELPGVEGGWFALPDPGRSQAYQDRYQQTYGSLPHPISGLAFDGIAAIGALVAQGNADALTGGALTQGAGFQGVNGIFRLRPDGTNERGLAVATVQDKQVVVIDPAQRSFSAGF